MVHSIPSEPSTPPAESGPASADGDDPFVELVVAPARRTSRATTLPQAARFERLRRLVLELRVAALEANLERARQRRLAVIEHYERLLDSQEPTHERPVYSWHRRP